LENISVIIDIPNIDFPIIPDIPIIPDLPVDITNPSDENIPSKDVSPAELLADIGNAPWWWDGSRIVELNDETSLQ
jgi:hypothetical protein